MRILLGHNYYRAPGGECRVFADTVRLLQGAGHEVHTITQDSAGSGQGWTGRWRLLRASLGHGPALEQLARQVERVRPQVAHFHNVYPWLTPRAVDVCARRGVPVVVTCHNYRLVCPIGTLYQGGQQCDLCRGGRVYHCLLRNCRQSRLESGVYALRSALAPWSWRQVSVWVAISQAMAHILARHQQPPGPVRVVHNPVPVPASAADPATGEYVAFAGRDTPEKGFAMVVEAAARLPRVPFRVAGVEGRGSLPSNVQCLGQLPSQAMEAFWRGARLALVPSLWQEPFGLTAAEAQALGLPVVAFRNGGLADIVDHGRTGYLCDSGDMGQITASIHQLWNDHITCRTMGQTGRQRMIDCFGEARYVRELEDAYTEAGKLAGSGGHR